MHEAAQRERHLAGATAVGGDAERPQASPCSGGTSGDAISAEERSLQCPSPLPTTSDGDDGDARETDGLVAPRGGGALWTAAALRAVRSRWQLAVWCPLCVAGNVAQTVTLDVAGKALASFPYWLFWTTAVAFLAIFAAGFGVAACLHKGPGPYVDAASRAVPLRFFASVGFLTTMNGVFLLFSGPHVPGVMQALLGPTVVTIPMSMCFSAAILGARYSLAQVGAVMVIVGGVLLAVMDTLTAGTEHHDKSYWTFLWFCGSVPVALNCVYEERVLAAVPTMPMPYVMALGTVFQVLTIFVVATPLAIVPGFGPIAGGFAQLYPTQKAATKCVAGLYPVDNATGRHAVVEGGENLCPECRCDVALAWVLAFTAAYVVANYSNLAVVKHGGATLMFVVSTLVTPISAFCFSAERIVGAAFTESLSEYNYAALAVLVAGITAYRCATAAADGKRAAAAPATPGSPHFPAPPGVPAAVAAAAET